MKDCPFCKRPLLNDFQLNRESQKCESHIDHKLYTIVIRDEKHILDIWKDNLRIIWFYRDKGLSVKACSRAEEKLINFSPIEWIDPDEDNLPAIFDKIKTLRHFI